MNAKETLLSLFETGELSGVLDGLHTVAVTHSDDELLYVTTIQAARFNDLKDQQSKGTLRQPDYQVEIAKIREALLGAIVAIPNHWPSIGLQTAPFVGSRFFQRKWVWALVLVMALIMIVARFSLSHVIFPTSKPSMPIVTDTLTPHTPIINVQTKGTKSPAVNTSGDVHITIEK